VQSMFACRNDELGTEIEATCHPAVELELGVFS